MDYTKQNRLETFVERHRADFDLHEPRPDLWAALEQQLHGEAPAPAEPVMNIVAADEPAEMGRQLPFSLPAEALVPTKRRVWAERYSMAAALVVLLLAAGLGEAWKSGRVAAERGVTSQVTLGKNADAALYLAPSGELMPSPVNQNLNARLDTAVRGMETYYVSQLTDRKAELSQLAPEAAAEWSRELVDLDSSYQRLKRELPSHPQPEVVLTAMNKNLQIRLDILDRQLELRDPAQTARVGDNRSDYALADSREFSQASLRHDR